MTFENNPNVQLLLAPPQINVSAGASATVCNSGTASGAGTIVIVPICP
jgi:hypothetical protein